MGVIEDAIRRRFSTGVLPADSWQSGQPPIPTGAIPGSKTAFPGVTPLPGITPSLPGGDSPSRFPGGIIPADSGPSAQGAVNGAGFSYSFNPEYQEGIRRLLEQRAGLEFGVGTQSRRLGEDYNTAFSDLTRNRDEYIQAIRDRLASNGILRSGINIAEQGKAQEAYGRDVEGLNRQRSRGLEDLQTGLTTGLQDLQAGRNQLDIARARTEEANQKAIAREEAERQANARLMEEIRRTSPQSSPTGQYYLPYGGY